jgi:response regulator of citrate/malate metabolism
MRPDELFTAEQQQRLAELLARWRAARDTGASLPPQEQAELDALVQAELRAATERSAALGGERKGQRELFR